MSVSWGQPPDDLPSSLDHAWNDIPRCDCQPCVDRLFADIAGRLRAEADERMRGDQDEPTTERPNVLAVAVILATLGSPLWAAIIKGIRWLA